MLGRGKLVEDVKFQRGSGPQSVITNTVMWNGTVTTGAGVGVDTQPYDEVIFVLDIGAIGLGGSIAATVYESDDDNADNATAVSGATFTTVTPATDFSAQLGYIKCKNYKRYMYLRTACAAVTPVLMDTGAWLGRGENVPVGNSPVFDLNY